MRYRGNGIGHQDPSHFQSKTRASAPPSDDLDDIAEDELDALNRDGEGSDSDLDDVQHVDDDDDDDSEDEGERENEGEGDEGDDGDSDTSSVGPRSRHL